MEKLLKKYLNSRYMMQLATVSKGRPWSCTVYYIADDKFNLYWASLSSRRHSKEIQNCDAVAISIPVQHEKGQKVIGVQAEGTAKVVENTDEVKPVAERYASTFGRDAQWVEDFSSLKTGHKLYRFIPSKFVLFDEENYPHSPRQEIVP